jgi:mannose-6-phosphate isomerase-like protein (cupin superfamily)
MRTLHRAAIHVIGTTLAFSFSSSLLAQMEPPEFVQFLPDQIKWQSSAAIPPGGQSAVLYGDPRRAAPFVTRVRQPADYKIPPHTHPEERTYTVISGTFYVGFGDKFDPTKLKAFPAGSMFVVPANTSHFHWMRSGEAVVQISGVGPSGIEYVDHDDDPRKVH